MGAIIRNGQSLTGRRLRGGWSAVRVGSWPVLGRVLGIALVGGLASCTPASFSGKPGQGAVDVRFEFADGHVETRSYSATQSRVEGCRVVQRLQLFAGTVGDDERVWVDILFSEEAAEPVRLSYMGALTGGAYASWEQVGDLSAQYREQPWATERMIERATPQPVKLDVTVDEPWAAAPDIARVEVTVDGAYRAQWWLNDIRPATIYCDQVTGEPRQ